MYLVSGYCSDSFKASDEIFFLPGFGFAALNFDSFMKRHLDLADELMLCLFYNSVMESGLKKMQLHILKSSLKC